MLRSQVRRARERARREADLWLFAAMFIAVTLGGLGWMTLFGEVALSADGLAAVWASAVIICLLAPPPVSRFVWHTIANVAVAPPQRVQRPWVIDGDTLDDLDTGVRFRLANIDAPETGDNAKCFKERERGEAAKRS